MLTGIVAVGLLVMYYHLGGFKKIQVRKIDNAGPYVMDIWGKEFTGDMQDTIWKNMFVGIRNEIIEGQLKGPIMIIYYKKPDNSTHKGKIEAFIGAEAGDDIPPSGNLKERMINVNGVIRASLNMHPVLMPSPERVKKLISQFAKNNHLREDSIMIEKYFPDNTLQVEVPYN